MTFDSIFLHSSLLSDKQPASNYFFSTGFISATSLSKFGISDNIM